MDFLIYELLLKFFELLIIKVKIDDEGINIYCKKWGVVS